MSRVEESDHVEMTSGEGKEEAVQLNGAGAARASIPGSESVLRGFVRFFLYPLFRAIEINRCWETKSCVGVSPTPSLAVLIAGLFVRTLPYEGGARRPEPRKSFRGDRSGCQEQAGRCTKSRYSGPRIWRERQTERSLACSTQTAR